MRRVLVIDDEQELRALLARALKRWGWEVSEAGDGREGLAAALNAEFEVVICDVRMPVMDGLAFLEALKAAMPEIPVIMVSGSSSVAFAARSAELGAYAFLSKPYDVFKLHALVDSATTPRIRPEGAPEKWK